MHAEAMKHKASLWDGDYGTSGHITDVHWEGDITPEELIDVADQITSDWQTIDLELDPAHPSHGQVFRLRRPAENDLEDASAPSIAQAEDELAGKYVWVHCCRLVEDPQGDIQDEDGRTYRKVFHTVMFSMEFTSFDDVAVQCDENFDSNGWSEYELFLDDDLPVPVAHYR
jgi:hypothetical protein